MPELVSTLAIAVFLVTINERLTAGFVAPLFAKFKIDNFYLLYVAWVLGGALVWVAGINLFGAYIADPLVGRVLSAIVAGGGANLLHDLFDR